MLSQTLRVVADLIDQGNPAEYVGVGGNDSVTIVVSNEVTAVRWRQRFDDRRIVDGVAIVLAPIGVPS